MKRLLNGIYHTERGRILFAFGASVLILMIVLVSGRVSYYDCDDLNIAWALAGYRSGSPSFSHPFINCIMAAVVSGLYTLVPALPWWWIVQWFAVFLGMSAVFYACLAVGSRRNVPMLVPLFVSGVMTAVFYAYLVVSVTFTLSSAAVGAGAAALVLADDGGADSRQGRRCRVFGVALLVLAFLVRHSSGLAVACFYFGALAIRFAEKLLLPKNERRGSRPERKKLVLNAGIAALCVLLLIGTNAWGRRALNPDGFLEFDEARGLYMDYPHDSYHENPVMYGSLGWSEALTRLVNYWFYMDERVTADTLRTAFDASAARNVPLLRKLSSVPKRLLTEAKAHPIAKYALAAAIVSVAALVALFLMSKQRRVLPFLAGLAYALGTAALLSYLVVMGRMNLRVLLTVLLPFVTCVLLICLELYDGNVAARAAGLLLAGAMLFPSQAIFRYVIHIKCDESIALSREVTAYVMAHPDTVFYRDTYTANNFDAYAVYPDEKPTNLMDWGGCDMYTAARTEQMQKNGITSPYADVFLQENVRYIGTRDAECLHLLDVYMQETYQTDGYTITDELSDGIVVVSFAEE